MCDVLRAFIIVRDQSKKLTVNLTHVTLFSARQRSPHLRSQCPTPAEYQSASWQLRLEFHSSPSAAPCLSDRLTSCNSLNSRMFSMAVALSRCKHSASCWRSSAFVCACLATDVFTTGPRSLALLFVEPFLVVLAIKN